MANAIIDQNYAKNWSTVQKTLKQKHTHFYPLRKEKQKTFVIVKLAQNITSCCISARKGD